MIAWKIQLPTLTRTLFFLVCLSVCGCGDYNPCKELAIRICTDCPSVSEEWQAACMCIENGSVKERGFKCDSPDRDDQVRCNAILEDWNERTCDQLN